MPGSQATHPHHIPAGIAMRRAGEACRGFSLVATLSMLLVITLIAVGFLSLSSVSIKSAEITSARERARANARMALMIALDQLQTTMGPDKRISARAATMARHPALNVSVPPQSAKAWWVGAASSDRSEVIGLDSEPVVWLVSGLRSLDSAKDQIASASPFVSHEIVMYGANSINLTLTGGEEIMAGAVPICDRDSGAVTGSYAYFVDDNGMKAQLAASHRALKNTAAGDPVGTVIPGTYDLSILEGMDGMQGVALDEYLKLNSANDLPLLGNQSIQITKDKRMAYTTRSLGVLSDVKHGGLKKDLTIAFEKYTTSSVSKWGVTYPNMPSYPVFDQVFPKTSDTDWGKYLLVDESKRGEFGEPGYIHWAMLRDYYNLKRYILRDNGRDCLAPVAFNHSGMNGNLTNNNYARGILPPHQMGPATVMVVGTSNQQIGMPYGDIRTAPNGYNTPYGESLEYTKHSPLVPFLSELQFNCWLEKAPATPFDLSTPPKPKQPTTTDALRTNVQIWASHYNPYNIDLWFNGGNGSGSFYMRNLPGVWFIVSKGDVPALDGFYGNADNVTATEIWIQGIQEKQDSRSYSVKTPEHLGPGRAMFSSFEKDVQLVNNNSTPGMDYGTNVRDLVTEKMYKDYNVINPLPPSLKWSVSFSDTGLVMPGITAGNKTSNYVVSQFLHDFMPRDPGGNNSVRFTGLGPTTYNDNSKLCLGMRMRTTKEAGNSIRPLVDANIRGFYQNRRWDQPLGTDMIAAYTAVHNDPNKSNFGSMTYDQDLGRVPQMATQADGKGHGYWGAEHGPFQGNDRVILFDIPREDLVSLGQLQHANVGRFSYEPSYIIGNSYANPRIPLDQWKGMLTDTTNTGFNIPGSYAVYDASYLTNEALWDGYIFTTIPQVKDNYNDADEPTPDSAHFSKLLKREALLPNPRFIPYEPKGSSFNVSTLQSVGNGSGVSSFDTNAGHLLVDGAFNVNSTSVDAWEAFLSGTHGLPFQKLDENGVVAGFEALGDGLVRFPRVQSIFGKEMTADRPDENYWVGFRALEQSEVRQLAAAIVDEIVQRGPFLSLADFVNRKLERGELGEKGALQAALDKTVNKDPLSDFDLRATNSALPRESNQAAGFPGQLLQGDILQALSPCMTVRSDTFTIRAYGESLNPVTGKVIARAWCEAVVQRYPDPIRDSSGSSALPEELAQPASPFGRQFRITSFRWLNPGEV